MSVFLYTYCHGSRWDMNEADTCRTYVMPKLKSAGWESLLPSVLDRDPKGFLGYRSTRQAGRFCLSGRKSAGETFRVSDDEGQCVETLRVSSVIGRHVRQGSLAYHDEGQPRKPLGSRMMVIERSREKSPWEAERNCNKIGR